MSQTIYATVDQLKQVVDLRILQQLSTDAPNVIGDPDTDVDGKIETALKMASADVETHALRGRMYSLPDLEALRDDEDWTLIQIVCYRAVYHMWNRRGGQIPSSVTNRIEKVDQSLTDLRDGKRIFRLDRTAKAGRPTARVLKPQVTGRRFLADGPNFPRQQGDF